MTAATALNLTSIVRQSANQVGCNFGEEVVLLNVANGDYYNFDDITSQIWNSLGEPRSISELIVTLCEDYDVLPQQCERDVLDLVSKLLAEKLVELV